MFCSTSISVHLLRGLVAFGLIFGAFYFNSYSIVVSVVAFVGAIFLLRGCPMCWLLGLFETMRKSQNKTPPGSQV
jgi:hypothetical protein